jgi:D-beta-D-heptose 7-phosphate kinase/D-beta-D-heptose 1-phosphate adenosyltransferase
MGVVITDWNRLAAMLDERRERGDNIVSTNGVFDVLHVGHVRYLQAARALGDLLVVGINTDAGTGRLKGPERPFVPEDERAELVAALECVDYVTLFDESTPEALLMTLRPDIHVKGGDYDPTTMPETSVVEHGGGRVVVLPFVAGRSTTDLVERIRRSPLRSAAE